MADDKQAREHTKMWTLIKKSSGWWVVHPTVASIEYGVWPTADEAWGIAVWLSRDLNT